MITGKKDYLISEKEVIGVKSIPAKMISGFVTNNRQSIRKM